ncbi:MULTISPECIES: hypothetical protein [unclassified Lonepinella]|uniref:hypothetical protein n=1 Tax=unclassified Lonepinella TaxID=2642006 RepID=UPI003F6DA621
MRDLLEYISDNSFELHDDYLQVKDVEQFGKLLAECESLAYDTDLSDGEEYNDNEQFELLEEAQQQIDEELEQFSSLNINKTTLQDLQNILDV